MTPGKFLSSLSAIQTNKIQRNNSLKSGWIPFQADSDGSLSFLFIFQVIEALLAIAIETKFSICEAVTIQFQAHGFVTITMFPSNS